jgi:hypothetical protein
MMFGERGNPGHDDSVRIIHRALPPGVTLSVRDQGYQAPALTDPARRRRG